MRRVLVTLSVICAMAPARAPAEAWQPMERGGQTRFTVGVRSGYSWGLGDADGSESMKDFVGYQIPVQLDLGWRFVPDVALGAYLSYGFAGATGATKDLCDAANLSCPARALRAGVQLVKTWPARHGGGDGIWRDPRTRDQISKWLGLGLGYDAVTLTMENSVGTSEDMKVSGIEWTAQGGFDFYSTSASSLGLFASISLARFTTLESSGTSGSISNTKLHEWLTVGLRGEFGFGR